MERGARPAAKKNVKTNDEINEANDAQAELQAPVWRLRNDFDGRFEGNAVACDGVEHLAPGAGAVESPLQIVNPRHGRHSLVRRFAYSGQQISLLNAGMLASQSGQHTLGKQAARGLAPPNAIVGLLTVLALLHKVQDSQHEQCSCGQDQQCRLHAIEKACLHGREFSASMLLPARQLPRRGWPAASHGLCANRLRIRMIWTAGSWKRSTPSEVDHIVIAKNKSEHPEKRMDL